MTSQTSRGKSARNLELRAAVDGLDAGRSSVVAAGEMLKRGVSTGAGAIAAATGAAAAAAAAGEDDEGQAIVIDCGSRLTKVGFAGAEAPSNVFRTVVGRPRHRGVCIGTPQSWTRKAGHACHLRLTPPPRSSFRRVVPKSR